MDERDIVRVRIDGALIGIVGLTSIMTDLAAEGTTRTEEETKSELLRRVSVKNYVPARARESYGHCLLKEFRKFRGNGVEEEVPAGLRIHVLGPGCARCSQMEMDVREVLAEMKLPAELIQITDFREISRYGVLGAPALVINDRVVSVGTTPHKNKIKAWLSDAASAERKE
jgi:small redox-active disulfide protein 2